MHEWDELYSRLETMNFGGKLWFNKVKIFKKNLPAMGSLNAWGDYAIDEVKIHLVWPRQPQNYEYAYEVYSWPWWLWSNCFNFLNLIQVLQLYIYREWSFWKYLRLILYLNIWPASSLVYILGSLGSDGDFCWQQVSLGQEDWQGILWRDL